MKYSYPLALTLSLAATVAAQAQNVGIGTPTPNAAAALDITATGKGLLIPRMDSATRVAIAAPPTGLMVFQNGSTSPPTRTGFYYYAGGTWLFLADKARAGDNLGNHSATQALGLNSNQLRLKAPTDSYHVLQFSNTYNGPELYGYGGGGLGYTSDGLGVTPVITWNRNNVASVGVAGANNGGGPDLAFGGNGTGEGIGSARNTNNPNRYGLDFYTNYSKRMSINNNGYVGIGIAEPYSRLHLVDDYSAGQLSDDVLVDSYGTAARPSLFLRRARGSVGAPENLQNGDLIGQFGFTPRVANNLLFDNAAFMQSYYRGDGTTTATDLQLYTSGTERLRISEVGDVGIGTAPSTRLDVVGGVRLRDLGAGYVTADGNGNLSSIATVPGDNLGNGQASTDVVLNNHMLYLRGTGDGNHALQYDSYFDGPNLHGYNGGSLSYGYNGSTSVLRWDNSGLVGIASKLAVGTFGTNNGTASDLSFGGNGTGEGIGSARNTNNPNRYGLDFYTGFTKRVSITSTGSLGVGTATPNSTLQVNGSLAVGVAMGLAGSGAGTKLGDSPSGYVGLVPTTNNDYYLLPAATTCPGRLYYIRNNSQTNPAYLSTEQGYIYEGGSIPNTSGSFVLQASGLTKTITAISDGQNWTVLKNGN